LSVAHDSIFAVEKPRAVLDIGSGLGGVDVLLKQYYGNRKVQFYLLDKSGIDKNVYYGLTEDGACYSSAALTKEFLMDNGFSMEQTQVIDISTDAFPVNIQFDVIISFISWGFHYSIDTYLKETAQVLSEQGVMLLDIRRSSDAIEKLKCCFSNVQVVPTQHLWSDKWDKVLVQK
jgi:SAM-dependent methyltransferase